MTQLLHKIKKNKIVLIDYSGFYFSDFFMIKVTNFVVVIFWILWKICCYFYNSDTTFTILCLALDV